MIAELRTPKTLEELFDEFTTSEEEEDERNDVYVYQTLRYPPKSTPPTPT